MLTKFNSVLIIGMGLIGSSIARALYENNITSNIFGLDSNMDVIKKCLELDILLKGETDINNFSEQFDLIIICTPLNSYKNIFSYLNNYVSEDTLLTDVGSTKVSVIEDFNNHVNNKNIKFVPSHPIAGLEKSGPQHGFSSLFQNRYCIITPINKDNKYTDKIIALWESIGMKIEKMDSKKHDRVLAMTSHIPQLIAYSVVTTSTELEAAAFRRLLNHLNERTDVQNIDLMNLAGFCRNCLSRWYKEESIKLNNKVSDEEARKIVYGMPYKEWKDKFQREASKEQMENLKKNHPN